MKLEPRAALEEQLSQADLAVLTARAERLRQKHREAEDEAVLWTAEFPVGGARWAVPLITVRAVVPLRGVTPVPLAPPHVLGLLRFEGRLITAYSTASLLGVSGWLRDPTVLLIVEPEPGKLAAIDCEAIPKANGVAAAAAQAPQDRRGVRELLLPGAEPLHLCDVAQLLAAPGVTRAD